MSNDKVKLTRRRISGETTETVWLLAVGWHNRWEATGWFNAETLAEIHEMTGAELAQVVDTDKPVTP